MPKLKGCWIIRMDRLIQGKEGILIIQKTFFNSPWKSPIRHYISQHFVKLETRPVHGCVIKLEM